MSKLDVIGSIGSELADRLKGVSGTSVGLLLDLNTATDDDLQEAKLANRPVVLTGTDSDKMAQVAGIGADCEGAVWHPGVDGGSGTLVYLAPREGEINATAPVAEKAPEGAFKFAEPTGDGEIGDDPFAPMQVGEVAADLEAVVQRIPRMAQAPQIDPIPDGAAGKQYILVPDKPFTYHPKSYTWKHYKKPVVLDGQTATLSLPVFVELYASPDPANKFLRTTAYGTGSSPGGMVWNASQERGMFQDIAEIWLSLVGLPRGSTLLTHEPKTQNNSATYTSSSSFTIGIKGSKNGAEPSASATVGASVSSTLSDFRVQDKSAGLGGDWRFEMQLCGLNSDGKYNINKPTSLIDWKAKVWEVPGLASSTLFPACLASWSTPLDFNGRARLTVEMYQRLSYVACNYVQGMSAGCEMKVPFNFAVDFSDVTSDF